MNTFLAAIIAVFFWGKTTKDVDDKTRHASWIKTIIYLVLSIMVGVFFYKTYQVVSVFNTIDITALRASYDSDGNIADSIECVLIRNKFSSDLNYDNHFYRNPDKNLYLDNSGKYHGGISFNIISHNNSPYIIKNHKNYPKEYIDYIKPPVDSVDHFYVTTFIGTSIPSLIPIYPKVKMESEWQYPSDKIFMSFACESTKNSDKFVFKMNNTINNDKDKALNFDNGVLFMEWMGSYEVHDKTKYDNSLFSFYAAASFINNMNFFTAGDVSQYTYVLDISSDCPISRLEMFYDLPIEINSLNKDMTIGTNGFSLEGDFLEEMVNGTKVAFFHIKLPTLVNLQLVRSLILTTILTALISLFASNLYYLTRKWALSYKKRHKLTYSQAKAISKSRVKIFKAAVFVTMLLLLSFSLFISWLVLNGKTIEIPIDSDSFFIEYIIEISLGITLIIVLVILFLLYKYMRKPVKNKVKEMNTTPPYIFIHNEKDVISELFSQYSEDDSTFIDVDDENITNPDREVINEVDKQE